MNVWAAARSRSGTIAWLVMAVAVSLLFYDEKQDDAKDRRDGIAAAEAAEQANVAVARVEREGLVRDFELCDNSNQARAGIVAFIERLVGPHPNPEQQEFLDIAQESFAPIECPPEPE